MLWGRCWLGAARVLAGLGWVSWVALVGRGRGRAWGVVGWAVALLVWGAGRRWACAGRSGGQRWPVSCLWRTLGVTRLGFCGWGRGGRSPAGCAGGAGPWDRRGGRADRRLAAGARRAEAQPGCQGRREACRVSDRQGRARLGLRKERTRPARQAEQRARIGARSGAACVPAGQAVSTAAGRAPAASRLPPTPTAVSAPAGAPAPTTRRARPRIPRPATRHRGRTQAADLTRAHRPRRPAHPVRAHPQARHRTPRHRSTRTAGDAPDNPTRENPAGTAKTGQPNQQPWHNHRQTPQPRPTRPHTNPRDETRPQCQRFPGPPVTA